MLNSIVAAGPEPALWPASTPAGPGNVGSGDAGQRAAVQGLRRLARRGDAEGGGAPPACPGTARAAAAFRAFLDGADQAPGARAPTLGDAESPVPTKDERCLLRALAAAQRGKGAVLDAHLCKFALDRRLRASLAEAVLALAADGTVLPGRIPPPRCASPECAAKRQTISMSLGQVPR